MNAMTPLPINNPAPKRIDFASWSDWTLALARWVLERDDANDMSPGRLACVFDVVEFEGKKEASPAPVPATPIVEYADPQEGYCHECKSSFSVHLMTCSKFRPNCKPHGVPDCKRCATQGTPEGTKAETIDDYIRKPCRHCKQGRTSHVGVALACFGGYGTCWNPAPAASQKVEEGKS